MTNSEFKKRAKRWLRELGIDTADVQGFNVDLQYGVILLMTSEGPYEASVEDLWDDYADHAARLKPRHVVLKEQA